MSDFHKRKAERAEYNRRFVYGRKLVTCSACNGSGHYDHNGSPPCGACDGTGKCRAHLLRRRLRSMAKKTSPKVSEARKALDDIIALAAGSGVRLGTESTFRTAGLTFTREQGGVIGVHEKGAVYMNRIPPSAAQALAAWLQRACDADPHDSSGPK